MVHLQPGDIVRIAGGDHMVDFVNESRAHCIPLTGKEREILTRFGDHAVFSAPGNPVNIATSISLDLLMSRGGKAAMQEFLSAAASRRRKQSTEANSANAENNEGQETMASAKVKSVKLPARGGLAAAAAEAKNGKPAKKAKAAKGGDGSKGKLGQIMGHSTCAIIRLLAYKGASKARIGGILGKLGVTASPATIQIQYGKGKSKQEGRAQLSGEQLEELLGKFAEPAVEEKESPKKEKKEKADKTEEVAAA